MYNNAYSVYKNNSVNYASKNQLLLMLVDGAVRFAKVSRQAIEDRDITKAHENLIKTQDIFTELMISLNIDAGDWAKQLFAVYQFINDGLAKANISKKVEDLDVVMPLIQEVRDTWHEADKLAR